MVKLLSVKLRLISITSSFFFFNLDVVHYLTDANEAFDWDQFTVEEQSIWFTCCKIKWFLKTKSCFELSLNGFM